MTEKPIIFSSEMVRAILNGRKTQTRRVIKPHNAARAKLHGWKQGDGLWIDGYNADDPPSGHIKDYSENSMWIRKESYVRDYATYKVGDVLWVRETWYQEFEVRRNADGEPELWTFGCCGYAADGEPQNALRSYRKRPSIHMPRAAARLFLRVTDVRVERLNDISRRDIVCEGLPSFIDSDYAKYDAWLGDGWFVNLWDSINAKRNGGAYVWHKNPWVYVYTFERIDAYEGMK